MRMVIEGRDFLDLRKKSLVDLLDTGTGKGACLSGREGRKGQHDTQQNDACK
jgi:hypothetical protein